MAKQSTRGPVHLHVKDDSNVFIHLGSNEEQLKKETPEDRLANYQKFLNSLKRPDSKYCTCPEHLHPRPWVPAPCRTTRTEKDKSSIFHRRSFSSPDIMKHSSPIMDLQAEAEGRKKEKGKKGAGGKEQKSLKQLNQLYKDARILKDTLDNMQVGAPPPRNARAVVDRWSCVDGYSSGEDQQENNRQKEIEKQPVDHNKQRGQENSRQEEIDNQPVYHNKQRGQENSRQEEMDNQPVDHNKQREQENLRRETKGKIRDVINSSFASVAAEEVALREELNNNLMQENERLKKKVRQLQRRMKRQEQLETVSHESIQAEVELGGEAGIVYKKKYEDLLQYVLKVEGENQKLKNSMMGGSEHGSDNEILGQHGVLNQDQHNQQMHRLHQQIHLLQGKIHMKDEYIHSYEERLVVLEELTNENASLKLAVRNLSERKMEEKANIPSGDGSGALEEEWMRRLSETREMYEKALSGYREQIAGLQEQFHAIQEEHRQQLHDMQNLQIGMSNTEQQETMDALKQELERRDIDNKQKLDDLHKNNQIAERELRRQVEELHQKLLMTDREHDRTEEQLKQKLQISEREHEQQVQELTAKLRDVPKSGVNFDVGSQGLHSMSRGSAGVENSGVGGITHNTERLAGALENLGRKMENIHMSREENIHMSREGTAQLTQVKDMITASLKEWKESNQNVDISSQISIFKKENEEMQKKLKGKNKKLESVEYQLKDLEEQNQRLSANIVQLESQLSSARLTERLGAIHDLPETLRETENSLNQAKSALQQGMAEKQALRDQIQILNEKVAHGDSKLSGERTAQNGLSREMEELKEKVSVLHHQLQETSEELSAVSTQVAIKDQLLDSSSAQLEDRIRECAALSAQLDRSKLNKLEEMNQLRSRLGETDSSSNKQLLDIQAQASRYQAQLSSLRSEKEQTDRSYRQQIRRTEDQYEQLQLKYSTLQRQFSTVTSTYHAMFNSNTISPPVPHTMGDSTYRGTR